MSEAVTPELDLTPKECTLINQMHHALDKGSHYTLLGVPEDADPKKIRQAYYDLSRHWHPDRFFRREVGEYESKIEDIFSAITLAYQLLSDETKRRRYDQKRLEKTTSPGRVSSRRRRRRRRAPQPEPTNNIDDRVEISGEPAEDNAVANLNNAHEESPELNGTNGAPEA